jgi:hypothetical protein
MEALYILLIGTLINFLRILQRNRIIKNKTILLVLFFLISCSSNGSRKFFDAGPNAV